MTRLIAIFIALLAMASVSESQDVTFSVKGTEGCLAGADSFAAQTACVGVSANDCMVATEGGDTTVGMGACLWAEYDYWDARLNSSYHAAMKAAKSVDADMAGIGATVPSMGDTLQAMQRAWIPFRDAACDYERSKWGGGTGSGPAGAACMLQMTGAQALLIEGGEM